jgi:hypothetical protein
LSRGGEEREHYLWIIGRAMEFACLICHRLGRTIDL